MTIAVVTSDLYPPRLRRLERKEASLHSAIVPQVGLCPHGADVRSVAMDRDTAAFERLFAHFAPRIKGYFLRLGVPAELAEELAQETMVALWRKAESFDPTRASVATWLFTIARNKRIDRARRDRRPDAGADDMADLMGALPGADAWADATFGAAWLTRALTQLPPDQRQVLDKAFYEEKSHSAIAEELGLPLGTVKSRIRLALVRLKALVTE
ncbi:MAG: sigma-70 family RNA polymerase sigma factor [Sphingomonadales bacterium]|nr:MAG: sigma-70 family RNA polymerase sigma factor [Sphingomonadales bacterium]